MSLAYFAKRLFYIILTLLVVSILVFGITQILPGNAAIMILGQFATPEQVSALEEQLGLRLPAHVQYWRWFVGILRGDWGNSMQMSRPVLPVVLDALQNSLYLAIPTLALVTFIAIPLGALAAVYRGSLFDLILTLLSYLGVSLPEFVTATLLIAFLARPELGVFPSGGFTPPSEHLPSFVRSIILPVGALAIILTAHISRQTRSEMVDVLQSEYIRAAILKGLPRRMVLIKHALRNALLPTITVIALDVRYLLGGIVVVEEVFAFPGIGRLTVFAVQNRDLPLIQACVLMLAAAAAISSLLADLLYAYVNPRIQYE
ncbi:MAG: ABC transporter permease [Anaerolineae bacterium]